MKFRRRNIKNVTANVIYDWLSNKVKPTKIDDGYRPRSLYLIINVLLRSLLSLKFTAFLRFWANRTTLQMCFN